MKFSTDALIQKTTRHPLWVVIGFSILTLLLGLQIFKIRIDTDPENMLSEDTAVRVFHNRVKKDFTLYDMIVLGVVDEKHPEGVFNPATLGKIHKLTEFIESVEGVIRIDLLAPSRVDDIQQAGLGSVRFDWLMKNPPANDEEALAVRKKIQSNPLLDGTMVSADGKAICLYIPIREKKMSYAIASQIETFLETLKGDEEYFITGLPVAEDTFGVQMFIQMAESAPMAGITIFLLMWYFFRNVGLIVAPMLVAVATVVSAMGLLIGYGYTVHIMSSMIPIFLMPIAVVDSVHILSEFSDAYPRYGDRVETLKHVYRELFNPMLFTSLTSAVGFASLSMTPIPPVQVFGVFVAIGIMWAWILTIVFIPAYVMLMKESSLQNIRLTPQHASPRLAAFLMGAGRATYRMAWPIVGVSVAGLALSALGVSFIHVNDNPVKWFERKHPIRVADEILNRHFGGTYMAYLVFSQEFDAKTFADQLEKIRSALKDRVEELKPDFPEMDGVQAETLSMIGALAEKKGHGNPDYSIHSFLREMKSAVEEKRDASAGVSQDAWEEIRRLIGELEVQYQPFKNPETLRYLDGLKERLLQSQLVGKSNSLADLVKKVHFELMEGNPKYNSIPETSAGVAQTLLSFQNSHDPDDLWHLVTPDYLQGNVWVQLKSGDNRDMEAVVRLVEKELQANPPPFHLKAQWAGLTYLNVIWQNEMVHGMLKSLLGSFGIVLLMMIGLFRSFLWGILCMVPLTLTITFVYGVIGFIGKDYDMPIAVLSALTLGLSVDFAIHFLERARSLQRPGKNWEASLPGMFGEPARAIMRNIIVIAVGFTPLMIAPLVPYQTVGYFMAAIMVISGAATLILLPAFMRILEPVLFKKAD